MEKPTYFRVNFYIPDADGSSDGFEDSQDFYCESASAAEAEEKLLAEEPEAAGVTSEEISEDEFNANCDDAIKPVAGKRPRA